MFFLLGSCKNDIYLKFYCCSQLQVSEELSCGDILVATKLLFKNMFVEAKEKLQKYVYLTTTRETQLYHIEQNWNIDSVKKYPFSKCKLFLELLQVKSRCKVMI